MEAQVGSGLFSAPVESPLFIKFGNEYEQTELGFAVQSGGEFFTEIRFSDPPAESTDLATELLIGYRVSDSEDPDRLSYQAMSGCSFSYNGWGDPVDAIEMGE